MYAQFSMSDFSISMTFSSIAGEITRTSSGTMLRLIRSGESLDFSALASLAALRSVQADETMIGSLRDALRGSGLEPELVEG